MTGIQNNPNIIMNKLHHMMGIQNSSQNATAAGQVTAEGIYKTFLRDVKTEKEFRSKVKRTLTKLNANLSELELEDILESLPFQEQPPFCASYSEEGVAEELGVKQPLDEADLYAIFLLFYNDLYDRAKKNKLV